ncbi:MAG: DUF1003 domain-containing protein [Patescibacteria group bacterium]
MTSKDRQKKIERASDKIVKWIGSTESLIVHTIFFSIMVILTFSGIGFDKVILIFNTMVSLEAIYLAIFIQMTVNKQGEDLEEVSEDIGEIQEDVEEIQKDVDEIQEDMGEIQEDVEEIEEASSEEQKDEEKQKEIFSKIENSLRDLMQEISDLKSKK